MSSPVQSDQKWLAAEVFLRARFLPLCSGPEAIASKMWATGMPKPYRAVKRISGARTQYTDEPLMRAHTFGSSYDEAAVEADRNDSNIMVLVDYPGWSTVMPDGSVVHCDWAEITDAAHEETYGAESVVTRFVSEYRFGFSSVPA